MSLANVLPLPRNSAYDPPMAGEGRLDPLGFAVIADRIADSYARPVRARMRRIRFLTTMAIGGTFIWDLNSIEPAVAGDTADIAFERVVVEALAHNAQSGVQLDTGIPGITKAQAALLSKSRLDARGYLKSPRVFGFSGVYRPLAQATSLADKSGGVLEAGRELIVGLETDSGLRGLATGNSGTKGGDFLAWLAQESANSLRTGRNCFSPRHPYVSLLASIAAPQGAGPAEREALHRVLTHPRMSAQPEDDAVYLELLLTVNRMLNSNLNEWEMVHALQDEGSPALKTRMQMVIVFEEFARELLWAFDTFRFVSSQSVGGFPDPNVLRSNDVLRSVAGSMSDLFNTALTRISQAVDQGVDPSLPGAFAERFSVFGETGSIDQFIEALMTHHAAVQKNKAPDGKRPWIEASGAGYAARPMFTVNSEPELQDKFIHQYRLMTLVDFLADIHG
jgi:hypothetical protein